jgi:hypothetical protein
VSFTTRDRVKLALGIPTADTTHDAYLDVLVSESNSQLLAIFQLTQCDPLAYTRTYDIHDSDTEAFWLTPYPVISVDEIRYSGTTQTLTDFYTRNPTQFGLLSIIGNGLFFPFGRQAIEVTHTAGWATVPPELEHAATVLAVLAFNTDGKIGYDSERIGQYQYTIGAVGGAEGGATSPGGWPSVVQRALANHMRPFASGA